MIFGSDNFLIKNLQFTDNENNLSSKVFTFSSLLSFIILPIYFIIAYFLLTRLEKDIWLIFLVFIIAFFNMLSGIAGAIFQAKSKYEIKVIFSSFCPHLLFLIAFLIHLASNSLDIFVNLYLYYYLAFYGIFGLVVLILFFRPKSLFLTKQQIKSIILFGLTYALYTVTTPIANILIGEKYSDFGIVGIFSISTKILTISAIATGVLSNISNTVYAKLSKEQDNEKLFNYYQTFTRLTIYLAVPFYMAFIFEAHNILAFFGDSYLGNDCILILLTISSLIETITGPCGSVLLMGGKEKENLIASIVRFGVYIALIAILINFTVLAAPIASIVSCVISNFLKLFFLYRYQKRIYISKSIIFTFLIVGIISAGCFFGLSFITIKSLWLVLNCVVGLGLIIGFILLTPYKSDKKFFINNKEKFDE